MNRVIVEILGDLGKDWSQILHPFSVHPCESRDPVTPI